jgi:hypothetical protein
MLGDRRGWLLLLIQPFFIVAVAVLMATLIDGTRWLVVFVPLVALIAVWIAQAVDAYQRAVKMGAQPGGEMAIAAVLPIALFALTLFWVVGGRHASPTATLQQYVEAWVNNRPDAAAPLFSDPRTPDSIAADWAQAKSTIQYQIYQHLREYDSDSGLDLDSPLESLRFRDAEPRGPGLVAMPVDLVANQRVETTVLGIIPTAGQQTVKVQSSMTIWLEAEIVEPPTWLSIDGLDSTVWKIKFVEMQPAPSVIPA